MFFWQQLLRQVLMLGGVSALLEGNVGDPLVVPPALFTVTGYLHQAVALPGICVRVLWETEKMGFSGSSRSVQGAGPPSPRAPVGKTGWLKIACWVTRPGRGCPRDMPSVAEQ